MRFRQWRIENGQLTMIEDVISNEVKNLDGLVEVGEYVE